MIWGFVLMPKVLPPNRAPLNRPNISKAIRTLHLAFKGKSTAEIYDILMEQLLRAIQKYDPAYMDKVRKVGKAIDELFTNHRQLVVDELNGHLDFDCNRYLRMFGRRGFLQAIFSQ